MSYYLCGDVGGTNSRLQLFELLADGTTRQVAKQVYPSRNYAHLSIIIKEFLTDTKVRQCLQIKRSRLL
jgi:glucokinase